MDINNILSRCDHTLLRQDATAGEIVTLCDEATAYGCASVCIPPCHVSGAKNYVDGKMRICTVIGFPNGYNASAVKAYETSDAVKNGADEIDMVINLAMVKDECWESILAEIKQVRAFCSEQVLKVIIETCLLTDDEKKSLCGIVSASGADYIKTSTGFSTGGATREDIKLMREYCSPSLKIKASGGIASLQDAQDFIDLGADRLGTSRIVKLAAAAAEQSE